MLMDNIDTLSQDRLSDYIRLKNTFQTNKSVELYRFQWSPDGRRLALPYANGEIVLWDLPTGNVQNRLSAHIDRVYGVAWSPKEPRLASVSRDGRLIIWDMEQHIPLKEIELNDKAAFSVAWSPDGHYLAVVVRRAVWIMSTDTFEVRHQLSHHHSVIYGVAWSPDGRMIASASSDKTVVVCDTENWQKLATLDDHTAAAIHLLWSLDSATLITSSADRTIRLWDAQTWKQKYILEGHTSYISSLSLSSDGQILASKSGDGTIRLWRFATSELISVIEAKRNTSGPYLVGMQFHPYLPLLATSDDNDHTIYLWQIGPELLLGPGESQSVHYMNAKVVLVGDTGVGKSGLSLVLAGQPFQKTESTHGRSVLVLDEQTRHRPDGVHETCETLLWDLAGQPGYRLIHQLHLHDVALALVVYDSRDEVDPLSGAQHWVKALQQAHRLNGERTPLRIFLVAARTDRGSVGIGDQRIKQMMNAYGIEHHFETSAREGWGIGDLRQAITNAIDWEALPRVSSTALFNQIKEFVIEQRERGVALMSFDSLYLAFAIAVADGGNDELRAKFETCINLMVSRGLIERLSFGDLILLQPELLDAYASAFVNAARNEPDGLGYILEEDVMEGRLRIPSDVRVKSREQEQLFLIATVQKLLRYEIALRVQSDEATFLVFPSQLTRKHPDLVAPVGRTVKFRFEGILLNIYATLVVRLAQSGLFRLRELWKNAAAFSSVASKRGEVGIYLKELSDSEGELSLFFSNETTGYVRYQFEEYIRNHLQKRVVADTIKRIAVISCHSCGYLIPDDVILRRKDRNFDWLDCPVCNEKLSLADHADETVPPREDWIKRMDKVANDARDRDVAVSTISGKRAIREYDVFLCHNSADKTFVKEIGLKLREMGLLPWLDEWELRPGVPWQKLLEQEMQKVKAAAVFVGTNGIGPWQDMEQAAFIREFVKRSCPVIPVVLPNCNQSPELPVFLNGMTWVDFRQPYPNPVQRLVWGITGQKDQA